MSIRLRFTLLYNAILALTLVVFGGALYSIQSQTTYNELKKDLIRSSDTVGSSVLRTVTKPGDNITQPPDGGAQGGAQSVCCRYGV